MNATIELGETRTAGRGTSHAALLEPVRLAVGEVDAVAFARPFIANPDLVERFRLGAPPAEPDPTTVYGGGENGYTDYPPLKG